MGEGPHLVIGLGNPGERYAGNRHNIGFMVLDELVRSANSGFKTHKAGALVSETRFGEHRVIAAKPMSFMNLSGGPVAALAAFFKVPVEQIVVVHDELDIPFGTVRLKKGGGDNGHNGLRSITQSLGSPEYVRVRVGIGRPPGRQAAADFVLRDFPPTEREDAGVLIGRSADAVLSFLDRGLEPTQNLFHAAP